MESFTLEIVVRKLCTNELTDEMRRWMKAAVDAAEKAYSPYSYFQVGAVVALSDGRLITGNNQENMSYPSGICAERVALFSAGANDPDATVSTLTLVALRNGVIQDEISPCGACRQVLLETERRQGIPIKIVLCGQREVRILDSALSLMPLAFGCEQLGAQHATTY